MSVSKHISDIAFTDAVKQRQEEMGSRGMYQKMAETRDWQYQITDQLQSFIAERDSFYLASVNADGQPYIQHKGGSKGFLKVLDDQHVAYADYSGNRQYISLGNFDDNSKVHIFLMDYTNRRRIKIWGKVMVLQKDDPLFKEVYEEDYGANVERIVKIKVQAWDVNCPQHIQSRFTLEEIEPHIEVLKKRIKELEGQVESCCPKSK